MQGPRDTEIIRVSGLTPYDEALIAQRERRDAVERGQRRNALFLLEHTPTITLGRGTNPGNILLGPDDLAAAGIEVHETDRGGDVTYHGPGQMVAYPVLNLEYWRKSVHWYLRALEEVIIRVLARYDLRGERIEGLTGVWVGDAKVAAIGVGIRKWVTFHGAALNVNPNMAHFGFIVPCGIRDKPVTSLEALIGKAPAMDDVMRSFEVEFLSLFDAKEVWRGSKNEYEELDVACAERLKGN